MKINLTIILIIILQSTLNSLELEENDDVILNRIESIDIANNKLLLALGGSNQVVQYNASSGKIINSLTLQNSISDSVALKIKKNKSYWNETQIFLTKNEVLNSGVNLELYNRVSKISLGNAKYIEDEIWILAYAKSLVLLDKDSDTKKYSNIEISTVIIKCNSDLKIKSVLIARQHGNTFLRKRSFQLLNPDEILITVAKYPTGFKNKDGKIPIMSVFDKRGFYKKDMLFLDDIFVESKIDKKLWFTPYLNKINNKTYYLFVYSDTIRNISNYNEKYWVGERVNSDVSHEIKSGEIDIENTEFSEIFKSFNYYISDFNFDNYFTKTIVAHRVSDKTIENTNCKSDYYINIINQKNNKVMKIDVQDDEFCIEKIKFISSNEYGYIYLKNEKYNYEQKIIKK